MLECTDDHHRLVSHLLVVKIEIGYERVHGAC